MSFSEIISNYAAANENLVNMIDNIEQVLQSYTSDNLNRSASIEEFAVSVNGGNLGTLGTASRVGAP